MPVTKPPEKASYLIPVDALKEGELAEIMNEIANYTVAKANNLIKLPGQQTFTARELDPSDVGATGFALNLSAAGSADLVNGSLDEKHVIVIWGFALPAGASSKITKITIKKGSSVLAVVKPDPYTAQGKTMFLLSRWAVFGPKDTITITVDASDATTESVYPLAFVGEPVGEVITA